MLTPAPPSRSATRPRAPGSSATVTSTTSSAVVFQPWAANTFFATAGRSTTIRTKPRPLMAVARKARMFTFFAPRASATWPSIPGRFSTQADS